MGVNNDRLCREAFFELWSDVDMYKNAGSLCTKLKNVCECWTLAMRIVRKGIITVSVLFLRASACLGECVNALKATLARAR